MESIVWAVALWLLVFILIPYDRVKQIWPVAAISFVWMFFLNYLFVRLGYYMFMHKVLAVGGVPIPIPVGGAAGGILLMNWMQRKQLYKILIVLIFAGFLNLASVVFMRFNAFMMLHGFNHFLHYVVNVAGISILVWLSLALVGEEKIYEGNRLRFNFWE